MWWYTSRKKESEWTKTEWEREELAMCEWRGQAKITTKCRTEVEWNMKIVKVKITTIRLLCFQCEAHVWLITFRGFRGSTWCHVLSLLYHFKFKNQIDETFLSTIFIRIWLEHYSMLGQLKWRKQTMPKIKNVVNRLKQSTNKKTVFFSFHSLR